ncbi:MAG TPA: MazG nucleotide pyrophosphohydrolase domain-containing protein [Chlamydiales bacterium]|jgi:MazG family protein
MQELDELLRVADRLLGPEGCSWSKEQTLSTLERYLVEETHELIEAIDEESGSKMAEELGDVLYTLVFIAKLGESRELFTLKQAVKLVCEKLIRRHPHVFGKVKASSPEEIARNWEEIKKAEPGRQKKRHRFDGIPPSLPSLLRAEKMANLLRQNQSVRPGHQTEERLGEELWKLISEAEGQGISAEAALRKKLQQIDP